ncbi:MAG: chorismate lyase [Cyanobacteriota bacterium]|jgi:chorismate--pyruvate lyase
MSLSVNRTASGAPGLLPSPRPVWQASLADVADGRAGDALSGPWKLLLLGDGSPTRHLRLLSGAPLTIGLIAMEPDAPASGERPREVDELVPPLLRRQVWLTCGGESLGWAESWWNQDQAEACLRNRRQPIWSSLTEGRTELFREVDGLALVEADWLTQRFQRPGPYWSRHYRFFREGRELTVIREVFSPALERWLGPAAAREQI